MKHQDDNVHDELRSVSDRLRTHRPMATALELDEIKQRVLARAASPSHSRRNQGFMRSRAAILATLVLGFGLSSTGAGLAVSGFAHEDQASQAQYSNDVSPGSSVLPKAPKNNVKGESNNSRPAGTVETTRQIEAGAQSSGSLPFTGFAAIPVLLFGLAMLGAGLVMRRSSHRQL